MSARGMELLPDAVAVPFARLESVLAQGGSGAGARMEGRALTATVVALGPPARLQEAAATLRALGADGAVRGILIAVDAGAGAEIQVAGSIVAVRLAESRFINNAVAALRLSSLPTLVWWRGGPLDPLDELATLADRLVLDAEDPLDGWRSALELRERTALGDIRWTRLTRWRTLMAHFFDVAEVRAAARGFTALELAGSDRTAARLFARWLLDSLRLGRDVRTEIRAVGGPPLSSVRFGDADQALSLRLAPSGTCVETSAVVKGHPGTSRTVSLGDQALPALLREELRIRSRDTAFERTLQALVTEP